MQVSADIRQRNVLSIVYMKDQHAAGRIRPGTVCKMADSVSVWVQEVSLA
jgi:hypothetical protein